jgi:hypothetical protein
MHTRVYPRHFFDSRLIVTSLNSSQLTGHEIFTYALLQLTKRSVPRLSLLHCSNHTHPCTETILLAEIQI